MGRFNTLSNIPGKYTTPLGFTSKGKPIFLIAGGSVDSLESVVPEQEPTPPQAPNTGQGETYFTKADLDAAIERARQQEKDKVYGRLESMQTKLSEWDQREKDRVAAEEAARKQAEDEAKRRSEEDLSAKDLLTKREQEWQERLNSTQAEWEKRFETIQQEREQERALLEKEREFASLQAYTQSRLAEEQENIAPQLVDFINGRTKEEIEQSIAVAKAKSAEIAEQVRTAMQTARAAQRGTSITGFAPVGPMETEAGQRQYSPEDIAAMDMNEYAKFRKNLPIGGGPNNRGLFG